MASLYTMFPHDLISKWKLGSSLIKLFSSQGQDWRS